MTVSLIRVNKPTREIKISARGLAIIGAMGVVACVPSAVRYVAYIPVARMCIVGAKAVPAFVAR